MRVLHDLLSQTASRLASKPAVFWKDKSMSYGDVLQQSNKLATVLAAHSVRRGDRVAFFLEKRFEKVVSIFGISTCGGVMVPLRRLLKPVQVAHILKDSGTKVLITTYSRLLTLGSVLDEVPSLQTIIILDKTHSDPDWNGKQSVVEWTTSVPSAAEFAAKTRVIETDLAAILYTSGSTGNPKGVVLNHLNIVAGARIVSEYLRIDENDRLLSILTFSFDYGLNQLTTAFLKGAQIVLLDYLFPADIIKAVKSYEVTGLAAVAATWNQLVQLPWDQESMPSLRYITNSGGAIPQNFVSELKRRFSRTDIFLMYGLTEAFRSTYLDPKLVAQRPTSMGKAIPGEEIIIVDEKGHPVKPGETGELVHRGLLVSQGYWNAPELTSVRFRPNPLQAKEVPIRETVVFSGDYVRIDEEGFLYFVGRRDEMIKCSGNRVSPTEIEEVIYAHGDIQDAIVLGIPDEIIGHRIKALIVAKPDKSISVDHLLAYCKKELPPYMVPHDIEVRKELPRNANGKLDRAKVKQEVFESLT